MLLSLLIVFVCFVLLATLTLIERMQMSMELDNWQDDVEYVSKGPWTTDPVAEEEVSDFRGYVTLIHFRCVLPHGDWRGATRFNVGRVLI